jgi:hypothetical protein
MATASERADRNNRIFIERVEGRPVKEIAESHDLTPTRVRQILASGVQALGEDSVDPVQIALELRAEFELVVEEAKALVAEVPATNPAAKVGALKLVLTALERLTEWQRYMGVLPPAIFPEIDARRVAGAVMDVFEQHGVGLEVQEAMLVALGRGDAGVDGSSPAA